MTEKLHSKKRQCDESPAKVLPKHKRPNVPQKIKAAVTTEPYSDDGSEDDPDYKDAGSEEVSTNGVTGYDDLSDDDELVCACT